MTSPRLQARPSAFVLLGVPLSELKQNRYENIRDYGVAEFVLLVLLSIVVDEHLSNFTIL